VKKKPDVFRHIEITLNDKKAAHFKVSRELYALVQRNPSDFHPLHIPVGSGGDSDSDDDVDGDSDCDGDGDGDGDDDGEGVRPYADAVTPEERRAAVRGEFKEAWGAYEEHAWGMDEFHPVSRTGSHSYNMSLLMVDSLDTLLLMGLHDAYNRRSHHCHTTVTSS
jgi:hypothetical protein